ncbi:hypothetical protein ACHAW5_007058 [Stephanodiscus triporus]|uniref:Uncharacterized protein n=1 Tax=Stephanodiscus triporus TaxID=2934178 RepID=A0ABD3QG19_9STRA
MRLRMREREIERESLIRHRGSFVKSFSVLTLAFLSVAAASATALADALPYGGWRRRAAWGASSYDVDDVDVDGGWHGRAGAFLSVAAFGLALIAFGDAGSADFDDMRRDVMDALAWLDDNRARLGLLPADDDDDDDEEEEEEGSTSSTKKKKKRSGGKRRRRGGIFVFGGYSSGGHVAATVTQDAALWRDRDLPDPHVHCDSMLYISPVLSTRAYDDVIRGEARRDPPMALSSPSSPPPPPQSSTSSESESRFSVEGGSSSSSRARSSSSSSSSSSSIPPTWLTDQVVRAVFGRRAAAAVPSPIHTYDRSPPVPHVFLGCRHEMFGLAWLDTFFCSYQYSRLLNGMGIDSRYRAVRSDHWNILRSSELRDALREELGRIERGCHEGKAR